VLDLYLFFTEREMITPLCSYTGMVHFTFINVVIGVITGSET